MSDNTLVEGIDNVNLNGAESAAAATVEETEVFYLFAYIIL